MKTWKEQLDCMVDGELSVEEEQQLLRQCESTSQWRDLALAFTESQALKRELPNLFAAVETQPREMVLLETQNSTQENTIKASWGMWSLAAAILLALGVGYGAGWGLRSQSPQADATDFATVSNGNKSDPQNSLQWMVNTPDGTGLQQIEVPILSTDDLKETWQEMLLAEREKELLQQMRNRGLNLEHQRTLTPVRLRNGQQVVVPVDYFYEKPLQ